MPLHILQSYVNRPTKQRQQTRFLCNISKRDGRQWVRAYYKLLHPGAINSNTRRAISARCSTIPIDAALNCKASGRLCRTIVPFGKTTALKDLRALSNRSFCDRHTRLFDIRQPSCLILSIVSIIAAQRQNVVPLISMSVASTEVVRSTCSVDICTLIIDLRPRGGDELTVRLRLARSDMNDRLDDDELNKWTLNLFIPQRRKEARQEWC